MNKALTAEMIFAAKGLLKQRFLAQRQAQIEQTNVDAEIAHARFLDEQKSRWISEWKTSHVPEPIRWSDLYGQHSDVELFSASLDPAERIERLLEVGEYPHAVKVLLHRRRKVSVAELKEVLQPHVPVDGDEVVTEQRSSPSGEYSANVVVLSGVSPEFKSIIRSAGITIRGDEAYGGNENFPAEEF